MKRIIYITSLILASTLLLTACGQQKKTEKSSSSTQSSTRKATPAKKSNIKFANQTLTTPNASIKLGQARLVASAYANKRQLLIPINFVNNSDDAQVPSDVWSKYFSAKQGDHKLPTGSLSISGGNSDADNDAINNSVTPVDGHQTGAAAAMFQVDPNAGPVTLIIHDGQTKITEVNMPLPAN